MSVLIPVIISKIVLASGIPAGYGMDGKFLFIWGPRGKIFKVDLSGETTTELNPGPGRMKLIFTKGKKYYYLNRRSRELVIVDGKVKRKLKLSKHLPFGFAFKIYNGKIFFLLLRDSLMFEVLDLSGDSLFGFLKRDEEDSIVTAFSVSQKRAIFFNPVQSSLKIYNLASPGKRKIKIKPPNTGLWGVFRGGGSLKYLGGVAEIVELDEGMIFLSCFSYPTRRSVKPLTYILSVPEMKTIKTFQDPTFLVGKLGDELVFITYSQRKMEIEIWKEFLSR